MRAKTYTEIITWVVANDLQRLFKYSNEAPRIELHINESTLGFGSVLPQEDESKNLHPIYYMSCKTTPIQARYSSYELGTLSITDSVKKFRNYLSAENLKQVAKIEH